MGKQLGLFAASAKDLDDSLNAAQAELRLERMEREASRRGVGARPSRHHRSVTALCSSCGTRVTIRVSP